MPKPNDESLPTADRAAPAWISAASSISEWVEVDQQTIDAFAAATGDHQWIHTSIEGNPFGGPIAHGLRLVSLALTLARDSGALPDATWVIYAFDKLRFRSPVRCGARIRCIVADGSSREFAGRTLFDARLVIEIERETVPALTTNCTLLRLDTPGFP